MPKRKVGFSMAIVGVPALLALALPNPLAQAMRPGGRRGGCNDPGEVSCRSGREACQINVLDNTLRKQRAAVDLIEAQFKFSPSFQAHNHSFH